MGILYILIGILIILIATKLYRSDEGMDKLFKLGMDASLWKSILGEQRTKKLYKNFFSPLGIVFGIILIIIGIQY